MKKTNISFMAFIALLSVTSCHKGDATSATIDIMEPLVNDTISYNDTLHIEGAILGNGKMYGYNITLSNELTGEEYVKMTSDKKSKSYSFHEHWHNEVLDTTTLILNVETTLDHYGYTTDKHIHVVCLPQ